MSVFWTVEHRALMWRKTADDQCSQVTICRRTVDQKSSSDKTGVCRLVIAQFSALFQPMFGARNAFEVGRS